MLKTFKKLNLPKSGDASAAQQRFFLGTLGAFELGSAIHHGLAMLIYPLTTILARLDPAKLDRLIASLVGWLKRMRPGDRRTISVSCELNFSQISL